MYIELQGIARVVIRVEKPDKVFDKILFKKCKCYFYIHIYIYIYIYIYKTNSCLMSVCVYKNVGHLDDLYVLIRD